MEKKNVFKLQIERMPDGGFVVLDGFVRGDYYGPRFASTSIEEALKYCRKKLEAEHIA